MSDEATTLLAHLVPRLTGQVENAATDALGYILNKSATSREALTDLLGEGGFDMPPIARVETQVTSEDGTCPGMAGYDETGARRLLVESKLWASLREGQASGYLRQLDEDGPAALLFIAPNDRLETLLAEIVRQIDEASPDTTLGPTTSANDWRSAMVAGTPKRLALVSWDRLLRSMVDRAGNAGVVVAEDVRQLWGLVRWQDAEAFQPSHGEFDCGVQLVEDVVTRGVSRGWMSIAGLERSSPYGYGRYFRFVETKKVFWLGIAPERSRDTPLWLYDTDEKNWSPVHTRLEYPERLDDATSKVEDLARRGSR